VGLVYGKPVTLDGSFPKALNGTGHYIVTKFVRQFKKNQAVGFSPVYTQHVHLPSKFKKKIRQWFFPRCIPNIFIFRWHYLIFFARGFWNQGTAQTAELIFLAQYIKRTGLAKEDAFGG
jgi:hypothetical protein